MSILRWALSVFVIVMPLYGVFSGAQNADQDASQRGVSCHSFANARSIVNKLWPDLHFANGSSFIASDGTSLQFFDEGGNVLAIGAKMGFQQRKSPCVTTDGVVLTMTSDGVKVEVARRGNQYVSSSSDGEYYVFRPSAPVSAFR
jgi:hypothetical protein